MTQIQNIFVFDFVCKLIRIKTKDYKIDICCYSTKHAAYRNNSKDWLDRNQDNVSEWNDMSG